MLFAASNCTASSSFGRQDSMYAMKVFAVRWSMAVLLRSESLMYLISWHLVIAVFILDWAS
jgi:hypothetical protein